MIPVGHYDRAKRQAEGSTGPKGPAAAPAVGNGPGQAPLGPPAPDRSGAPSERGHPDILSGSPVLPPPGPPPTVPQGSTDDFGSGEDDPVFLPNGGHAMGGTTASPSVGPPTGVPPIGPPSGKEPSLPGKGMFFLFASTAVRFSWYC